MSDVRDHPTLRGAMVATAMHWIQVKILWKEWWRAQTGKKV